MTNLTLVKAEQRKLTFAEIVCERRLTDEQVKGLWYDWFCPDGALVRRGRALISKLRAIANTQRFPSGAHVFFKNNCPVQGTLYDSFSITDAKSGDVLYWVAPKLGYAATRGQAQVSWGSHGAREQFTGSWSDVKKFFLLPDAAWQQYRDTLPKPKFQVGTKVVVLGGYRRDTHEDEVAEVSAETGVFQLKGMAHLRFKASGEQLTFRHRRRHGPDPLRCEVRDEYWASKAAEDAARASREEVRQRAEAVRNYLYSWQYSSDDTELRRSKLAAIEAILGIGQEKK